MYPRFYHRHIDGDMLLDMTDDDLLSEMGVTDKFHRNKILKKVKELTHHDKEPTEEKKDRGSRHHHRKPPGHVRRSPHVSEREGARGPVQRVMTRASSLGAPGSSGSSRGEREDSEVGEFDYYIDVVEGQQRLYAPLHPTTSAAGVSAQEAMCPTCSCLICLHLCLCAVVYEVMAAMKDREVLEQWEQKVQAGGWGRGQSPSALTDDPAELHRGAGPRAPHRDDSSPVSSSGSGDEADEEERARQKRERERRRQHRRSHDKGPPLVHTQSAPSNSPAHAEPRPSPVSMSPLPSPLPSAPIAQPETRHLLDTVSATFAALSVPSGLTSSPSHPQLASKRPSASLYPPPQPVHPSLSDNSLSSSLPPHATPPSHPFSHSPQPHHPSPSHHPSPHHHSNSLSSPPSSVVPSRIDRLSSTLTTHPTFIDEVTNLTILNEGVGGRAYCGSYHNVPVVVKLPKSLEISGQEWREWQAHLRLPPHRHLVAFLGALVMEENNYLVTALIKQGSLKGVLVGEGGRLYRGGYGVMRAALEIGRGLCHLHRHRIVHRDISSRNILVESDGTFIIADLGLCREMGKASEPTPEESSYEMGRSTAIPIRWTAPEALLTSTYTAKTDVWSLGVTLWEMTTGGAVPYGHVEGNRRLIRELVSGDVGLEVSEEWAMDDEDGGLARRVRRVIARCLSRDVEQRPSSVELVEWVEKELEEWEREGGEEVEEVKREWVAYHRMLEERMVREAREAEEELAAEGRAMEVGELSVNAGRLVPLLEVSESRARATDDSESRM